MNCYVLRWRGGDESLWSQPKVGFLLRGKGRAKGVFIALGSLTPHPSPLLVERRGRRGRGLWRWWGVVFVSALTKRVRARGDSRPTMSQDLWVGRVFGSGLVSWRGNGTSVGVGFYVSPGNPQYSLRNQPGHWTSACRSSKFKAQSSKLWGSGSNRLL